MKENIAPMASRKKKQNAKKHRETKREANKKRMQQTRTNALKSKDPETAAARTVCEEHRDRAIPAAPPACDNMYNKKTQAFTTYCWV